MDREFEKETDLKDEDIDVNEKNPDDWLNSKPFQNIEKEIIHSALRKTTEIIENNISSIEENEEEAVVKEVKEASPKNKLNSFRKVNDESNMQLKRTYTLGSTTIRRLNELKAVHPNLNIQLNNIVDTALNHYYEYIKSGGEFTNV